MLPPSRPLSLLQINYTEEELKHFAHRAAAKMASRNHVGKEPLKQEGVAASEGQSSDMYNGVTSSHGSKSGVLVSENV